MNQKPTIFAAFEPDSLLSNDKAELLHFIQRHNISKPIQEHMPGAFGVGTTSTETAAAIRAGCPIVCWSAWIQAMTANSSGPMDTFDAEELFRESTPDWGSAVWCGECRGRGRTIESQSYLGGDARPRVYFEHQLCAKCQGDGRFVRVKTGALAGKLVYAFSVRKASAYPLHA